MATKLLEDNVGCRCSVCYQTYGDERIERVPRILTCGHTYCTECLCRLERFNSITCPTCKRPTQTGYLNRQTLFGPGAPLSSGVESLPKNYCLLELLAIVTSKASARTSTRGGGGTMGNTGKCKKHDEIKKVYCRDDKCLICIYCQVYGEHKGHDCVLADEAIDDHHRLVQTFVDALSARCDELNSAFVCVDEAARAVKEREEHAVATIRSTHDALLVAAGNCARDLVKKAREVSCSKLRQLSQQKSAVSHIRAKVRAALEECQSTLECCEFGVIENKLKLERNVQFSLDLRCNMEPVTDCDMVCKVRRKAVQIMNQFGVISAENLDEDTEDTQLAGDTGSDTVTQWESCGVDRGEEEEEEEEEDDDNDEEEEREYPADDVDDEASSLREDALSAGGNVSFFSQFETLDLGLDDDDDDDENGHVNNEENQEEEEEEEEEDGISEARALSPPVQHDHVSQLFPNNDNRFRALQSSDHSFDYHMYRYVDHQSSALFSVGGQPSLSASDCPNLIDFESEPIVFRNPPPPPPPPPPPRPSRQSTSSLTTTPSQPSLIRNSTENSSSSNANADVDERDVVEFEVAQFLRNELSSLNLNASTGATSSSDFELAPESSGSDSDAVFPFRGVVVNVTPQVPAATPPDVTTSSSRHRRFIRNSGRGRGGGMTARAWNGRRSLPLVLAAGRSSSVHSSSSGSAAAAAAAAAREPRILPIPANSVCGNCPRPAKARCCHCSRLFCDNCKRYNGIPCVDGSGEHTFTAVRRVKSKSRRNARHPPFCNAAVEQPVQEDDEGVDGGSALAVATAAAAVATVSSSPRRASYCRGVRRGSGGRLAALATTVATPAPARPPRLWRCEHCTFYSEPSYMECEACGRERNEGAQGGESVVCPECTLVNLPGSEWCEACEQSFRGEEEEEEEEEVAAEGDEAIN